MQKSKYFVPLRQYFKKTLTFKTNLIMKVIKGILTVAALSLFLVACGEKKTEEAPVEAAAVEEVVEEVMPVAADTATAAADTATAVEAAPAK